MSSSAGTTVPPVNIKEVAGALLVAALCAALATVATTPFPPLTVSVLLLVVVIAVAVRVAPLETVAVMALTRAAAEGLNHVEAVQVIGLTLSPSDALNVAISIGALWWLLSQLRLGWRPWSLPLFGSVTFFFLLIIFTLSYSPAPIGGFKDVMKLGSALLTTFLVTAAAKDRSRLVWILVMMLVGALYPIVLGLWQFTQSIGFDFSSHGGLRILSVFDHPNHFGSYLATLMVAAWGVRTQTEGFRRTATDVVGALALICLILTLSRSAWMVAGMVVLTVGWHHKKLLGVFGVVGGAAVLLMPRVLDRVLNTVASSGPANSTSIRIEIWSFALPLWAAKPILGFGWGAFQSLSNGVYAHNDYLRVLIEAGIVGLVAFVVLMYNLVRHAWKAAEGRTDFPRAFLGLALGFVILSAISNNLDKLAFQWYFWTLAGVAFAWSKVSPAPNPADPEVDRVTGALR